MQHYIICRVTNALQIRAKKDKKEKSLENIEFSRLFGGRETRKQRVNQ
jgi:hypothetical protein